MKKINFLVSLALVAMTQVAIAAKPSPLTATLLTGTAPTMDGDESDAAWATATAQPINVIYKDEAIGFGVDGSGDLDATFKVVESDKMLYFLIKADDDIIGQDPDSHWAGDKVEVYFGLPGYDKTKGANGAHSRQFALKAQDGATVIGENGSNNYPPASNTLETNGVALGYVETATGYIMEISIDRAIALESLPAGTVAFDISIADNDEGAGNPAKRYRKSWFNAGEVNELWGSMVGAGSLVLNVATQTSSLKNVKESVSYSFANNILIVNTSENAQLEIFDVAGKKIMQVINTNMLNVEALTAGIYFANIKSAQGVLIGSIRFIK